MKSMAFLLPNVTDSAATCVCTAGFELLNSFASVASHPLGIGTLRLPRRASLSRPCLHVRLVAPLQLLDRDGGCQAAGDMQRPQCPQLARLIVVVVEDVEQRGIGRRPEFPRRGSLLKYFPRLADVPLISIQL